jgi:hypothetical protein
MRAFERIEDDVREFFSRLSGRIPQGVATVQERPGSFPEGLVVSLAPRSRDAAPLKISAHNGDGTAYLQAGLGTLLEIVFHESTYRGVISLSEDFGPICEAVVAGRMKEVVWHRGKALVRCVTTIVLQDGKRWRGYYSNSDASLLRIGESKRVVQYSPYVESP